VKRILALLLAGGCKTIVGIEDTEVPPDVSIEARLVNVGDGRDGPVVVAASGFTDDVRAGVTDAIGGGSTLLQVTSADGFAVGDEVVVIQMTGDLAGHYETGRVKSTAPGSVTLETPLVSPFPADASGASQVIHIPNFSSVTVAATGRLGAHAWDGVTGGVLFFRVTGSLTVEAGGVISADLTGFGGGTAGTGSVGGKGGNGGMGGAHFNCPGLCNLANQYAGAGSSGQLLTGGAAGDAGAEYQLCHAGAGGAGGVSGLSAMPAMPGSIGVGLGGGAAPSAGGANLTANVTRPVLGGGGAGGSGGTGGIGGGGGGGGGGPVGGSAAVGMGNGTPGGMGQTGGTGGDAGVGGVGGGIVIIRATKILMSGDIGARGATGVDGIAGAIGGNGGFGGFSGPAPNCAGASIFGGRGGGGGGGAGGAGGGGGGGGAGGSISLAAEELHMSGTVRATGGAGGMLGAGGMGGDGGDGGVMPAAIGPIGASGATGIAGTPGFVYISFVDECDGCATAADPAAGIMDL
jgi:hypothetical protein